jgi:hypothetical protein
MLKKMSGRKFLKNFEEHLKIAFSYRSRKKYAGSPHSGGVLLGKEGIEKTREVIVSNIASGFCPFSFFTSYIHRKTDLWKRQVRFYREYRFSRSLQQSMIKIVRSYKPVWRKKNEYNSTSIFN